MGLSGTEGLLVVEGGLTPPVGPGLPPGLEPWVGRVADTVGIRVVAVPPEWPGKYRFIFITWYLVILPFKFL